MAARLELDVTGVRWSVNATGQQVCDFDAVVQHLDAAGTGNPVAGTPVTIRADGAIIGGPNPTCADGTVSFAGLSVIGKTSFKVYASCPAVAMVSKQIDQPPAPAPAAVPQPHHIEGRYQETGAGSGIFDVTIQIFDKKKDDAAKAPVRRVLPLQIVVGAHRLHDPACCATHNTGAITTTAGGTYTFRIPASNQALFGHGHTIPVMITVDGGAEPCRFVLSTHAHTQSVFAPVKDKIVAGLKSFFGIGGSEDDHGHGHGHGGH